MNKDKINVSFQCSRRLMNEIQAAAKSRGQSSASLIRFAVIKLLAEMKEAKEARQ